MQIRNSEAKKDIDYILSPVKNESGEFFDSRKTDDRFPRNADANGAYNIARKGIWVIEQIRKSDDNRVRLAMTNAEWLEYAQTHTLQ